MNKELDLWQFIADRLKRNQPVMLLVVAESSGSSPGRQGYKMAVGSDGELAGSIGGGLMEINLVEQSRAILGKRAPLPASPHHGELLQKPARISSPHVSRSPALQKAAQSKDIANASLLSEQVHQKNSPNSSGMICSGKQTVIFRLLTSENTQTVEAIIDALKTRKDDYLTISPDIFSVQPSKEKNRTDDFEFEKNSETKFTYHEKLGFKNDLYIVGGGHCALALSELMSKMDFHIRIFDDRPDLNTIDKNRFAHEITIINSYEQISEHIPSGDQTYVVVMTLGYKSDELVIRKLLDKNFKYFGVLGSRAKMKALLNALKKDGLPGDKLAKIHTPIGLSINSRTPEEIAVSIAAEIISVKNH